MIILKKNRFYEYDYKNIPASEGIYGIHKYPAIIHFKLVESFINEFSKKSDTIYDPFCGSGVSLNVAIRMGRKAIGTDINPLAVLISKVRSYSDIFPEKYLNSLKEGWKKLKPDIPKIRNIHYWFKDYVIEDLGKIRAFIKKLPNSREKEFLIVVFSQTVRNVSLTRKGEFKRYRMPSKEIEEFNPKVLDEFLFIAQDYLKRLRNSPKPYAPLKVYEHNVLQPLPFNDEIDLIITSPPYGDSKTTVAYGEFFSFSLEWLNGIITLPSCNLDKMSLGGNKKNSSFVPNLPTLKNILQLLYTIDEKRAEEVKVFYVDLYKAIKNSISNLTKNGVVCFVVGNRRVKGITIPMDKIVVEILEDLGLKHYETRIRKISNKRIPLKNSPTNIKGKTDLTMNTEYIVIAVKP